MEETLIKFCCSAGSRDCKYVDLKEKQLLIREGQWERGEEKGGSVGEEDYPESISVPARMATAEASAAVAV